MFNPDWRQAWRWWSMRVLALGGALYAFLITFPHEALAIWQSLPEDVRALIPNERKIGLALMIAIAIARVVRQRAPAATDDR